MSIRESIVFIIFYPNISNKLERRITMKRCTVCGEKFIPNSNRQKYCSDCKKKVLKEQRDKARDKYYRKKFGNNEK
jgi:uncharacterized OB-fold protein